MVFHDGLTRLTFSLVVPANFSRGEAGSLIDLAYTLHPNSIRDPNAAALTSF